MEVDYFLQCYTFSFHFALYNIASITNLLVSQSARIRLLVVSLTTILNSFALIRVMWALYDSLCSLL